MQQQTILPLKEILCGRTPAVLHCADLKGAVSFYMEQWGFSLVQQVPGVVAKLVRESVTVQLCQRRADQPASRLACRLLVNDLPQWQGLGSAAGQANAARCEQGWGAEFGVSDGDGNRLLLVQSAPHRLQRKARA
ncbi:MAG: hypothetical protein EOO28_26910 [Comamonadaceae bacterium]|nr:MAG: hypothetical protein EOO28_26910 [Comamonadaceae bacterium]